MSTKSVFFKAVVDGFGIVNFDSNDQKYNWNRLEKVEYIRHENVSIGKASYELDNDGSLIRVPKISADCLRHAMWESEMPNMMPNMMLDLDLLINVLASPSALERGYLFTKEGEGTFVRKSPVRFSPARATTIVPPALETHSTSSPKTENLDSTKSATSFFQKETRGKVQYVLDGVIDIADLQFISLSDLHGRMAVHPDLVDKYRELLGKRLGSEISEPGYYHKKNDLFDIPEFGILLTQEQVNTLVQDILSRVGSINIQRTVSGYARTSSLKIKLVKSPIDDLFSDETGWVDANNTPMDFEEFYTLDPKGEERLVSFKEKMQRDRESSAKKNEKKKEEAAKKKEEAAKKKATKAKEA